MTTFEPTTMFFKSVPPPPPWSGPLTDTAHLLSPCMQGKAGLRASVPPVRSAPAAKSDAEWQPHVRIDFSQFTNTYRFRADEIMHMARNDSFLIEEFKSRLSKRRFLLDWAKRNQVTCPKEVVRAYLERCERKQDVHDRDDWLRANGLTEAAYLALMAERALTDWISKVGPAHFNLHQSFIVDWAEQNEVTLPLEFLAQGATYQTLEHWIVQQGPAYFGLDWNFEVALLQELQVTGQAAQMMARLQAA